MTVIYLPTQPRGLYSPALLVTDVQVTDDVNKICRARRRARSFKRHRTVNSVCERGVPIPAMHDIRRSLRGCPSKNFSQ
jgi:hypothetical protein